MSLLRNNGDNSINFTKASCTLEGCVKIWTTRVDSVGTETGKLLSNLANESSNQAKSEAHSDDENGDGTGRSEKRKKARSAEATLAKSYAQLKVKKLDLEFTVDPLFKKTSADFDEGGAGGLLMNHLALGMGHEGSLCVVFDSSDVAGADVADDEDAQPEQEQLIDLGALQGKIAIRRTRISL
jgi:condensin complex subunit 2